MTRMQNPRTLRRLGLAAAAALFLIAASALPVHAQALPPLPVDLDAGLTTPASSIDAHATPSGASVCTDVHIDADAQLADAKNLVVGLLDVPVPEVPVPLPGTPDAALDACVEADVDSYQAGIDACTRIDGLQDTTQAVTQHAGDLDLGLPVEAPDGAQACVDAAFDDGEAQAGAEAGAGPVQQGFRKTVDVLKDAWGFVRGLF